jgi:hypothetical protein
MDNGFVKFAYDCRDFDATVIPTQGRLDAGPLLGDLDVDLSVDDITALAANGAGEAVAKRILHLIQTPVTRFVRTLRTHFGQYWLSDWPSFDSRSHTIQVALTAISLRWQPDGEGNWQTVEVGERRLMLAGSTPGKGHYAKFLTRDDWEELKCLAKDYDPTQATVQIGVTHEALDRGDLKLALIDAATACELVIYECLQLKPALPAFAGLEAFLNLPLKTQLSTLVVARCPGAVADHLQAALNALKMRNDVVHDGWTPDDSASGAVAGLLHLLSCLLRPLPFKFPSADASNHIAPFEEWEAVRLSVADGY